VERSSVCIIWITKLCTSLTTSLQQFGSLYRPVDETLSGAATAWHGRTIEDERADTWRDLSIERGYPFY
jgi:hypothetical protein